MKCKKCDRDKPDDGYLYCPTCRLANRDRERKKRGRVRKVELTWRVDFELYLRSRRCW